MKFISLASLSISVISLVLPAVLAVSPEAQKVIDYIDDAEPTDLSPACFWSGYTEVNKGNYSVIIKAVAALYGWRKDFNCHLITEVVSNADVKDSDLTRDDWKDISRRFASAVSGQVYVLLGKKINKDSVWLKDEAPALNANEEVTGIEVWEIDEDGKIKKTSKVQDQAALALSDDVKKVLKFITNGAKPTDLNPACFYAGYTDTKGMDTGRKYAADWVRIWAWEKGFDCHLVFDVIVKAQVDPYKLDDLELKAIRTVFAQMVSGPVYVLLGKVIEYDSESVWLENELPALVMNNKAKIGVWEINTNGNSKRSSFSDNAKKVLKLINDDAKPTDLNPACFWSGFTRMKVGDEWVERYAQDFLADWGKILPVKCHYIIDVVSKANVAAKDLTHDDWEVISEAFAEAVSGQVYVLLGKTVRDDNVWVTTEGPALRGNKKVTGIEVWEIETTGKFTKKAVQDQGYIQSRIGWNSQQYVAHL
ncbi:hypothetical protein DXG01_014316 [Tephrocybe rancida]|nr:hypothetical protein DXG01_014316 [Tephrocybe rancida]